MVSSNLIDLSDATFREYVLMTNMDDMRYSTIDLIIKR